MAEWHAGLQRDDLRRIHPALVAWEELPDKVREENRIAARRLPQLLAGQGIEMRRERIVSAVGKDASRAEACLSSNNFPHPGEHAIVVVDPQDIASTAIGRRALKMDYTTVWLYISKTLRDAISRDYPNCLENAAIWSAAESWVAEEEFLMEVHG
jgi:hypothetical protein